MVVLASPWIDYGGEAPATADVAATGEGPRQDEAAVERLERKIAALPVWKSLPSDRTPYDWLLTPERSEAGIYRTPDGKSIVVANGMVARTLRIFPNLATTHLTNRMTGESMLRAVSGEGFITIDGRRWSVGALRDSPRGHISSPSGSGRCRPSPTRSWWRISRSAR